MAQVKAEESENKSEETAVNVKILFLDVDGVINTSAMWPGQMTPMSDEHIMRIGQIIKQTECKIVLSTTWRYMKNKRQKLIAKLNDIGDKMNVQFDVIGRTPYNAKQKLHLSQRAIEIKQYIDKHTKSSKYKLVSWCALDDMDLTAKNHKWHEECNQIMDGHFVQTDESKGITDEQVKQVVAILNGNSE